MFLGGKNCIIIWGFGAVAVNIPTPESPQKEAKKESNETYSNYENAI